MTTYLSITSQLPGVHCYPNVTKDYAGRTEIEHLQYPHRHLFHFDVRYKVTRDDRELEFFLLQDQLATMLREDFYDEELNMLNFQTYSCEQIAKHILECDPRAYSAEVSEDGENGALVCRD